MNMSIIRLIETVNRFFSERSIVTTIIHYGRNINNVETIMESRLRNPNIIHLVMFEIVDGIIQSYNDVDWFACTEAQWYKMALLSPSQQWRARTELLKAGLFRLVELPTDKAYLCFSTLYDAEPPIVEKNVFVYGEQ